MIIIGSILFFINIILKYFIKLLLWNSIIIKLCLIIVMIIILSIIYYYPIRKRLRLSHLRKLRLHFPYDYKFKSVKDQYTSLFILFIYLLVFIIGIFILRFIGIKRNVDLKIYFNVISIIVRNSSYIDLILNIFIILLSIFIYKKLINYILKFFKFHRVKLHLYLAKYPKYINPIEHLVWYTTIHFYSELTSKIIYLTYNLNLKKIIRRTDSLNFDLSNIENLFVIERLLISYLITRQEKLHYHLLFTILCFDIFFNNFIIIYTYKILPVIFIYDIWVKLTRTFDLKNRTYDIVLHYFIHVPLIKVDDHFLTFGNRTFEINYLKEIMKKYVHNDFIDKDVQEFNKKIYNNFRPFEVIKDNKYFIYLCVFILLNITKII